VQCHRAAGSYAAGGRNEREPEQRSPDRRDTEPRQ
jgi:hypothetical protein